MFIANLKAFSLLALPLMVVANPLVARTDPPKICNKGSLKCCESAHDAKSSEVAGLLGLLGLDLLLNGLIGVTCSPITVIRAGSTHCSQQTLCCNGESYGNGQGSQSLLNVGCSPISLSI
ncbi:hypothetical protein M413DRAFT_21087 [Hebeloma cylindrosporum]|uniref:Hydrophobin n=1 Tax=Hebeloma cylindrosporum TaxID=76867 RepID=A0A0C3CY57_HEBCY|nr:hypothetical protein M413DRAFT_21087 [Hebeloma cylindrosporum h7]